ncbi:hypothetical protein Q9R19_05100 [Microbacterium sp. ARD32]|uniref:hypothetical protein n=1 Tax=Microbacterium sp. ARD32 TaxID=2962577 RepID=UPI00288104D2|nr:hypothetical protein [Microbacterium sp. ARD32]MDT0157001.1 hypothetical protein [Microbacterium sp. ARD32]
MSFESSGEAQAEHIIETVPAGATLHIALDLEHCGDFFAHPPTRDEVDAILGPLLDRLKQHHGAPPVIYATSHARGPGCTGRQATVSRELAKT